MDIAKLECVIHKKKKYKRSIPQHVAENIVNRNFKAEKQMENGYGPTESFWRTLKCENITYTNTNF